MRSVSFSPGLMMDLRPVTTVERGPTILEVGDTLTPSRSSLTCHTKVPGESKSSGNSRMPSVAALYGEPSRKTSSPGALELIGNVARRCGSSRNALPSGVDSKCARSVIESNATRISLTVVPGNFCLISLMRVRLMLSVSEVDLTMDGSRTASRINGLTSAGPSTVAKAVAVPLRTWRRSFNAPTWGAFRFAGGRILALLADFSTYECVGLRAVFGSSKSRNNNSMSETPSPIACWMNVTNKLLPSSRFGKYT
mmetsp:Transcript_4547/g.8005  ORF Transcript_4547/g.8005 Transcript_4547/m.8005 type:complete len:253 (-) Transcript_4547:189-947(-)